MALRNFEFGIFDAQAADFDLDNWSGFRSILVYGNTTNQESSNLDYNPEWFSVGGGDLKYQAAVSIAIDQIKPVLGQIPVLIRVDLSLSIHSATDAAFVNATRALGSWDIGDTSNRYKDKSALVTWFGDAYAPYPGQDAYSVEEARTETKDWALQERMLLTITDMAGLALRNNAPIEFFMFGGMGSGLAYGIDWKPPVTTHRPVLRFWYLYPIEFYQDSGGNIDYTSPVQETDDAHYYIGAVERGQTGVAYKQWARNYTDSTQQVEIYDDFPAWTTPVQRDGTGTGLLDYVTTSEVAVSQKYTAIFYSTTQFEVLAEAYRDNPTSNHPQINSDASWRGTVGADWTSPVGGFTIPSAAWQSAGILTADEFEIGVRGNTTDTAWPADGNDQVEMTFDNAGVADATGWRPVCGQREQATAGVDVDATSKFFPLRHIIPANWPISNKCFIHDQVNIDEGTITSTQVRALGADTFTGSGNDDLVAPTGNYNGNANRTYRLQIDATGSPDTFSWSRDGTTSWVATGVNLSTTPFELEDGIWIAWTAVSSHTIGDYWSFDADTWGVTVGGLASGSHTYAGGSIVATTLPLRDFAAATWSGVSADSGISQSPASRIYLADTAGFVAGQDIYIQATLDDGTHESATIAGGGVTSTYIDLTTALTNDYVEGDFCTQKGSGEEPYWVRPVATGSTVEELKRLRLVARML